MTETKYKKNRMNLVLRHYGLSAPMREDKQARMAANYAHIYKKIVKRTSRMTIITGIVSAIYFFIKKLALPVPFVKIGTAVLLSASIGTGMYLAMKAPGGTSPALNPSVIIRPFTTGSLDKDTGLSVAKKLSEALNIKSGEGYSGISTDTAVSGAPWSVFGSVEKIDGQIVIIAKIIDSKTSRLLLIIEGRCRSLREIDKALDTITRQFPLLKKE